MADLQREETNVSDHHLGDGKHVLQEDQEVRYPLRRAHNLGENLTRHKTNRRVPSATESMSKVSISRSLIKR